MSYRAPSILRKSPFLARCSAWLALCFIATAVPVAHAADESKLKIREVQASIDEGVYELDAKADLTLPDAARKAVEAGLTLRLTYEITVDRVRRYLPDDGIAELEQRYEVSYHALSQRYLVKNLNTSEQQISVAQKSRYDVYFTGDDCLQKKSQAIKKAVKGQFGLASREHQTVKAIKW